MSSLRDKLPLSTRLLIKRAIVRPTGFVIELVSRAIDLAIESGLDFNRVWSPKRPSGQVVATDFGVDDFLGLTSLVNDEVKGAESRSLDVSIVMPVFNKAEYTFQCLRSLIREIDFGTTEVVIVDNASTDRTAELLRHFSGLVRFVRNNENRGFVAACNQGAAISRGKYLLFLNNDTVVLEGWLRGLLETIENDATVGAVGSLFLYPNGLIQEAGAIVWQNGETAHYGWGKHPDDRRYNFSRDVDYCSAASLLIRKELFEQIGGFDLRFAPAYYEDIDLCFGVRTLGKRVVYQPASRLIHYEGITAGRDAGSGFKRSQQANQKTFASKWRDVLDREQLPNDSRNLEAASNRKAGPAVIVFDERVPTPDRDAGSTRMFQILKSLAPRTRTVFVPVGKSFAEYEARLWHAGIETAVAADYARLLRKRKFGVAILSRPVTAQAMLGKIRRADPRTKIIFDMVDTYFIRLRREYEISGDEKVLREARRYEKLELKMAKASDQVWCASPADKKVVAETVPAKKIVVVPTIHPLRARTNGFQSRSGLLFVGHMQHRPNSDGIRYFVEEVFPQLRNLIPGITLDIVGTNTPEIAAFESVDIRVHGYVPSIDSFFQNSRVFVAPLRFGAGMKGKIGDALAYGLPVVTSSVGVEGTGLEHLRDVMIADTAESFASAVKELYSREPLWQELADNGYGHVKRNFTPEVIQRSLLEALAGLDVSV